MDIASPDTHELPFLKLCLWCFSVTAKRHMKHHSPGFRALGIAGIMFSTKEQKSPKTFYSHDCQHQVKKPPLRFISMAENREPRTAPGFQCSTCPVTREGQLPLALRTNNRDGDLSTRKPKLRCPKSEPAQQTPGKGERDASCYISSVPRKLKLDSHSVKVSPCHTTKTFK